MKILYYLFTGWFFFIMAIISIAVIILFSPVFLLPNFKRYKICEIFIPVFFFIMNNLLLGTRIKLIGKENIEKKRTAMYICNHQSWIDIPIFFRTSHCTGISKEEIKKFPVIGLLGNLIGTIYFDRNKTSSRIGILRDVTQFLKNGTSISLFPEGTRSIDGNLNAPNLPLLKLCYKLNIPVVPAAINGTIAILAKHQHYITPFKKVILKYCPAVLPENFKNPDDFADECWNKVVFTLDEIKKIPL